VVLVVGEVVSCLPENTQNYQIIIYWFIPIHVKIPINVWWRSVKLTI
jgi:hypothetical protein